MVHEEVDKYKLASKPSILDLLEEGVVESRNVSTGLVLEGVLTTISISGLVTEHNVELYKVEVVPRGKVVEHHQPS